jgi:SpoVK/Ycf46/Vps4 family AAA+-type ATPase/DNA-binding beta-propeller fold protein YncE
MQQVPTVQAFRAGVYLRQSSPPVFNRHPWYKQRSGSQVLYFNEQLQGWCVSSKLGSTAVGLLAKDPKAATPFDIRIEWAYCTIPGTDATPDTAPDTVEGALKKKAASTKGADGATFATSQELCIYRSRAEAVPVRMPSGKVEMVSTHGLATIADLKKRLAYYPLGTNNTSISMEEVPEPEEHAAPEIVALMPTAAPAVVLPAVGAPQLNEALGVSFVPAHPQLLVTAAYKSHQVSVHLHSEGQPPKLMCSIGTQGSGQAQFNHPWGVCVTTDSSQVVVVDRFNHRLQLLKLIVKTGGPNTDPEVELEFVRFISGDFPSSTARKEQLYYPLGAVTRQTNGRETVLVVSGNHKVYEFDLDGALVTTIGMGEGSGNGQLKNPTDIVVLPTTGELAVVDQGNDRVVIFGSESGLFERSFGGKGDSDGRFSTVSAIATDAQSNMLVLDYETTRLQVFDAKGAHLLTRDDLGITTNKSNKGMAWCTDSGSLAVVNGTGNSALIWYQGQQSAPQLPATCMNGHTLQEHTTAHCNYTCDQCHKRSPQDSPLHGCRQCDYDVCPACLPAYRLSSIARDAEKQAKKKAPIPAFISPASGGASKPNARYVCKQMATLRADCAKDSSRAGDIEPQSIVEVSERRITSFDGQARLHIVPTATHGGGWVSEVSGNGILLFELVPDKLSIAPGPVSQPVDEAHDVANEHISFEWLQPEKQILTRCSECPGALPTPLADAASVFEIALIEATSDSAVQTWELPTELARPLRRSGSGTQTSLARPPRARIMLSPLALAIPNKGPEHDAANAMQAFVRSRVDDWRASLVRRNDAASVLQRGVGAIMRAHRARGLEQAAHQAVLETSQAVQIQALWRGVHSRRSRRVHTSGLVWLVQMRGACVRWQALIRGRNLRRSLAAVALQRFARQYQDQRGVAAAVIQCCARALHTRRAVAAAVLQRYARHIHTRRMVSSRLNRLRQIDDLCKQGAIHDEQREDFVNAVLDTAAVCTGMTTGEPTELESRVTCANSDGSSYYGLKWGVQAKKALLVDAIWIGASTSSATTFTIWTCNGNFKEVEQGEWVQASSGTFTGQSGTLQRLELDTPLELNEDECGGFCFSGDNSSAIKFIQATSASGPTAEDDCMVLLSDSAHGGDAMEQYRGQGSWSPLGGNTKYEFTGKIEYKERTAQMMGGEQATAAFRRLMLAKSREMAVERRANVQIEKDSALKHSILDLAACVDMQTLKQKLQWSDRRMNAYAALVQRMQKTVGLHAAKSFVERCISDAVGRYALNEPLQLRHVLMEGDFGTGKRTAAELVALVFKVLGLVRPQCGKTTASGAKMVENNLGVATDIDVLSSESTHVIEVSSLKEISDEGIKNKHVYYIRVGSGSPKPTNFKDGEILLELEKAGSIAIFAGSKTHVNAYANLDMLRRHTPYRVVLPTLSVATLAAITAQLAQEKGYRLQRYQATATACNGPNLSVMHFIVSQRYSADTIRERNAHLALDMLDLAIMRKNQRLQPKLKPKLPSQPSTTVAGADGASPAPEVASPAQSEVPVDQQTVLIAEDFDVKLLSTEERTARRRAVDVEVAKMVGWDSGSAGHGGSLSPYGFFERARRTLLRLEKEQEEDGGADSQQRFNWNCVVTGNPGAGKTSFARLLHKFLRAYGALESDVLVERNAVELKGQAVGETGPKVQQLFTEAKGGALFIDEAYSLVGDGADATNGGGGRDSYGTEAVRTMLTELENHRGTTCVVLAGYRDKMGRLLRADPGLPSRFPFSVHIPDYTPAEVAQIAQQHAGLQGYTVVDELLPKIEAHIEHVHGGGSDVDANGRLAVNIVEAAIQQRAVRIDMQQQQQQQAATDTSNEDDDDASSTCSTEVSMELAAADFGIGKKLGDELLKEQIDKEVEELIGMGEAKEWFETLKNKVKLVDKTGDRTILKTSLSMVITGNPGTGKSTFTRLLFRFLRAYGILSKDVFIEKNGLELKGQYVGDTGPKVIDAVAEAKGGCLFLDEAYALADDNGQSVGGGGDSFSREAIRTLLTEVENNRTNLMVVMAGYKDKMDRLMRLDPGLDRRFQGRLHLPDYTPDELAKICAQVAETRFTKQLAEGLEEHLAKHIQDFHFRELATQNGGLAVNLVEKALERQSDRLVSNGDFDKLSAEEIKAKAALLTAADFGINEKKGPQLGCPLKQQEVEEEVASLVGMSNVKDFFETMKTKVKYVERGGDMKTLRTSLNMVLTGNPGTGKTTVARLVAKYLHAFGILPTDRFVEKNALSLKGQYVGQTGPTVKQAVADAMGGCLFIDEAYALMDRGGDAFSGEAIRMLLTEVENNRTNLLVILAGYEDKMEVLMEADPGLQRRFGNRLHLIDYNSLEIAKICETVARDRFDFTFGDTELSGPAAGPTAMPMLKQLASHIELEHGHQIQHHNGGLAVTLTEQAVARLAQRVVRLDITESGAQVIVPEDYNIAHGEVRPTASTTEAPLVADSHAYGSESEGNQASADSSIEDSSAGGGESTPTSPMPAPPAAPPAELPMGSVHEWLVQRRLKRFALTLHELGVREMADLYEVALADLEQMSMTVLEQRRWASGLGLSDSFIKGFAQPWTTASPTGAPSPPRSPPEATAGGEAAKYTTSEDSDSNEDSARPMVAQVQVQIDPRSRSRTRTRRAPPKSAAKKDAKPVFVPHKPKADEEEETDEEEEEEEPTEQAILEALKMIGVCPQSFKWSKRASMDQACMKCSGKKTNGRGRCGGYQCEGGSHWVCNGCLLPPKPEKPVERF